MELGEELCRTNGCAYKQGQALISVDTCLLVVGKTLLQWSYASTSEPGDTGLTSDGHMSTLTWGC